MRYLLILLLYCSHAVADDWHLVQKPSAQNPISVYNQNMPNSAFKAFKGVVDVPYSSAQIVALVLDSANMCTWAYHCQSVHPIARNGKNYTYIRIDGMWPVSARDVVVFSEVSSNATGMLIKVQQAKGVVRETKDYKRLKYFNNEWRLTHLPNKWTRIELLTAVDPAGNVPAWLVNLVAVEAPDYSLRRVREVLDSGRYGSSVIAPR